MKQIIYLILICVCIIFFIIKIKDYQIIEGFRDRYSSDSNSITTRFNKMEKQVNDQNGIIKKLQEKIDQLQKLEVRVKGVERKTRKLPKRM